MKISYAIARLYQALAIFFLLVNLSVTPVLVAQTQTASTTPTWQELTGLVKDIRLPGDQLKSLAVDMHMNLPLPLKISCLLRYQAPDQYSLRVFDGEDRTPIMFIADNLAFINDPLADDLSLIASAGVSFELVPQNEQYNANFAFNTPVDGAIKNRVELDFIDLFARVSRNMQVQPLSEHKFQLTGSSEQNSSCSADIDTMAVFPLTRLSMFVPENPEPVLALSLIEADGKIAADYFSFPLQKLTASGLPINRSTPQGIVDTVLVVSTVIKAVFARSAIRNPQCRDQIEAMLRTSVNWQALAEKDALRSAALRKIFVFP